MSPLRAYVEGNRYPASASARAARAAFFAEDAAINIAHPFNRATGADGLNAVFLDDFLAAFDHVLRTDYMAFSGTFEGADWVTSTGYLTGHFARDWLGLTATGALANLRFGEFHRIENGRAVESYIYLDLPELMIACDQYPIIDSPGRDRGYTGYLPGPATCDGLVWDVQDPARSASSYQMVTDMLNKLKTEDEGWRPYWHEHMTWWGPAGFGAFIGLDHFAGFQVTFEEAFSEWIGGSKPGSMTKHFTRFASGDYICSGGWPSLNCVQVKPFLGQPPTGQRIFMRVCDWWRREGDLLAENWIFVDIPHVLLQLGVDLFPGFHDGADKVLADLPK